MLDLQLEILDQLDAPISTFLRQSRGQAVVEQRTDRVVAAAAIADRDDQRRRWRPRACAPTLAASLVNSAAALPPEGAQFAPWGGPAALLTAPTLAASSVNSAAALPPEGARFAPWGGPAALMTAPTLAASLVNSAAALPPEGAQFAPWGGPAALTGLAPRVAGRRRRRERARR